MTQENLLLREDGYPHLPAREVTDNGVVKAKLVANMIRYTSATKRQAKAIVDGCFDGEGAINISDLDNDADDRSALRFIERWVNHHGAKDGISAEQVLSVIQHYPSITAITKSYADGVVPDTRNPYAEIEALRQENKGLRSRVSKNVPLLVNETLEYELEALRQENAQLRELLCLRSSSSTHLPYMDDGELQDNSVFPHIDYKRDSVAEIISKLQQRTLKELKGGAA